MRNYKSGIGIIAVLLCLAVGGSVRLLKLESPPITVALAEALPTVTSPEPATEADVPLGMTKQGWLPLVGRYMQCIPYTNEVEPNQSMSAGQWICYGQTLGVSGNFSLVDEDYYKVYVDGAGTLTVTFWGDSCAANKTALVVYKPDQSLLAYTTTPDAGFTSRYTLQPNVTQTGAFYYIRLYPLDNVGTCSYTLYVTLPFPS